MKKIFKEIDFFFLYALIFKMFMKYRKIFENLLFLFGTHLVQWTKKIDYAFPATELSRWMDTIDDHPGGWYHRVKHGHDLFLNLHDIYQIFGIRGVLQYPFELFKDFMTPHGIPLWGVQYFVNAGYLSSKTATFWWSFNVMDICLGSIGLYSTYHLYKHHTWISFDTRWIFVGIFIKTIVGSSTSNFIMIIAGMIDGIIVMLELDKTLKKNI